MSDVVDSHNNTDGVSNIPPLVMNSSYFHTMTHITHFESRGDYELPVLWQCAVDVVLLDTILENLRVDEVVLHVRRQDGTQDDSTKQ